MKFGAMQDMCFVAKSVWSRDGWQNHGLWPCRHTEFGVSCLRVGKHPRNRILDVTHGDVSHHLIRSCGHITPIDLSHNDKRFGVTWDPNQPFEMLMDQNEEAVECTDAGRIRDFGRDIHHNGCCWHQPKLPTWSVHENPSLQRLSLKFSTTIGSFGLLPSWQRVSKPSTMPLLLLACSFKSTCHLFSSAETTICDRFCHGRSKWKLFCCTCERIRQWRPICGVHTTISHFDRH